MFIRMLTRRVVTCRCVTVFRIHVMSDVMIVRCSLATLCIVIVVVVTFNYMYLTEHGFIQRRGYVKPSHSPEREFSMQMRFF